MIDKMKDVWKKAKAKFKKKEVEPCEVNIKFESAYIERKDRLLGFDMDDSIKTFTSIPGTTGTPFQVTLPTWWNTKSITTTTTGSYGTITSTYDPIWDDPYHRQPPTIYKKHKNFLSTTNKFIDRWTEDPIETERKREYYRSKKLIAEQRGYQVEGTGYFGLRDPSRSILIEMARMQSTPLKSMAELQSGVSISPSGYSFSMPYKLEDFVGMTTTPSGISFNSPYTYKKLENE